MKLHFNYMPVLLFKYQLNIKYAILTGLSVTNYE